MTYLQGNAFTILIEIAPLCIFDINFSNEVLVKNVSRIKFKKIPLKKKNKT